MSRGKAKALEALANQVMGFDGIVNRYVKSDFGRDLEIEIALTQPQFSEVPPRYEGAGRNIVLTYDDGTSVTGGINGDINVPKYLTNINAARSLQPDGWHVSMISQDRWKPDEWFIALRKPGPFEVQTAKCVGLERAWVIASLLAQAAEEAAR